MTEVALEPSHPESPTRQPLWLLAWGVCWLVPFAVYTLLLAPGGYGTFGQSWVAGAFFCGATIAGGLIFRSCLRSGSPGTWPVAALVATFAVVAAVYTWAQTALPVPSDVWAEHRELGIGVLRMDGVYLAVKIPELVFQQTLIYVLVRRLQSRGHVGWHLVGAFALVFGAIHLPLVAVKGLAGLPFVLAAAGSSLVFPPLIARFRGGVAYSFSVHLLTYAAAGVVLRLLAG